MSRSLLLICLLALPAAAADKAPAKKKGAGSGFKLDLNMPSEALPTGEKLEKKGAEKVGDAPKESVGNATYDILKVMHAKGFMRSPSGSTASGGELPEIGLTGNPPTTDKFTTMIRVKSKARNNVPIEVAIVDPRGDTVMSSAGTVVFTGSKQDEIDYQIDWEPTPLRGGGEYKVLIRLANEVKGTWPLKVAQK